MDWATHDAFSSGSEYLCDHSIIYFYRNPKFHTLRLRAPGHINVARGLRILRERAVPTSCSDNKGRWGLLLNPATRPFSPLRGIGISDASFGNVQCSTVELLRMAVVSGHKGPMRIVSQEPKGRRPLVRFRNSFVLTFSSLETNELPFRPTSPVSFSFCRLFRINLDGLQDIVKHTHYRPGGLHRLASLVRCPRPVSLHSWTN